MLNMKALVGIWIFYGKKALVISVLVVPYFKGIWISMEYMLNFARCALGAQGLWSVKEFRYEEKTREK